MIPKKLHYCWFGRNPKSQMMIECIKSWEKYCPDFEIIEWNEDNYDINDSPDFIVEAFKEKKWAFVTDYARLRIVYENGGVYFDTDVKLLKRIDPLLNNLSFFGMEYNSLSHSDVTIATGLGFGAEKGFPILKKLMSQYDSLVFNKDRLSDFVCTDIALPVFFKNGFNGKNEEQVLIDGTRVYPTEYFGSYNHYAGQPIGMTENSYSLHLYASTWVQSTKYSEYQQYLFNKYGEKKWRSGRAEKIETFLSDVKHIRNEKGWIFSIIWGLKNSFRAYLH